MAIRNVFYRSSAPNYDVDECSDMCGLACEDPSLTRQSEKEEADINTIVKNFGLTGKLPQGVRIPTYGDFDTVSDYQSALAAIREADESFMKLDASIRERFGNDPQVFLEYCSNPDNLDGMRELGLAVPPPPVASEAS